MSIFGDLKKKQDAPPAPVIEPEPQTVNPELTHKVYQEGNKTIYKPRDEPLESLQDQIQEPENPDPVEAPKDEVLPSKIEEETASPESEKPSEREIEFYKAGLKEGYNAGVKKTKKEILDFLVG